ncbi:MAG: DUF169 domain-containing protein [Candidatus Omnitrophica bacterium]|nr:DUF169 domain-containing protein [Candidatus Omnitrophota bacterium]
MEDLRKTSDELKRILSLKSYPVAVSFCKSAGDLSKGKLPTEKLTFCQMVKLASQGKWRLSCPADYMGCFTAQMIFGFRSPDEKDLKHHMMQFTDNEEIAAKIIAVKPKLKLGQIQGILVGPLEDFEPDFVILIVDSAQALVVIEAYGAITGEDLSFRNGTSSALCSYGVVTSYQTNKPNLSVPCVGAKRYGLFQDTELAFVLPWESAKKVYQSLGELEKTSRIPLPIVNGFLSPTVPVNYILKKEK